MSKNDYEELLKEALNDDSSDLSKQFKELSENISKVYEPIREKMKVIQNNLYNEASYIQQVLEPFYEQANKIVSIIPKIDFSYLQDAAKFLKNISLFSLDEELLKALKGSPLSKEEQEKIIIAAKQYADFGIPFPFDESLGAISKNVITIEYVNSICEEYSQGDTFKMMVDSLYKLPHANKQLVDEAVSCFNNKEYYACCCLLFSTIDREIISHQQPQENKKRRTYNKKLIKSRLESPENENHYFSFFSKINFLYLLSYYYSDGNDFDNESIEEYPVINRNFLDHGMTNRIVNKNDCIKLLMFIFYLDIEIKNII